MFDVIIMDMGGHDTNVKYLQEQLPHAKILKWTEHLPTIRRAAKHVKTRYFWVVSSCCDYTDFDFLWEPTPWQSHQIHCWPSGNQQFGDTFLIPTAQWLEQEAGLHYLEDYKDVNFEHEPVARLPWQTITYNADSLTDTILASSCTTPYVRFDHELDPSSAHPDPWLWRERPAVALTKSRATSLIPRDVHSTLRTQVYDYKYLSTEHIQPSNQPLDIVFISNGELNADYNYEKLRFNAGNCNRIVRVDNVKGRVAAYHAAAEASTTPWFFAVFAKLEVDSEFDWFWQPDYWQQAKHYIFHAVNPVNGLTYGHQAIIAYNRQMVLNNAGHGLDFTLDDPHEVVPVVSGTAYYHGDPWTCWRTAFRETLKLRAATDVESQYRLRRWTENCGPRIDYEYAKWSHIGAQDAVEYYESVAGEFDELKKSYEWEWLASYAFVKRGLTPGQ